MMGRYIIKPDLDRDFYVEWLTMIEDAVSWGDREFMISCGIKEDRLDRADNNGTSAFWFIIDEPDKGQIWKQQGWLLYSNMEEFFGRISDLYPDDVEIPENLLELHPELEEFLEPLEE